MSHYDLGARALRVDGVDVITATRVLQNVTGNAGTLLTAGNLAYARMPTGTGSWDVGLGNTLTLPRALSLGGTLAVTGVATLTGGASVSGTLDALAGLSGTYVGDFRGHAATGNSYGVRIRAGTNASDYALRVFEQTGTAELFRIDGAGATLVTGIATLTGGAVVGSAAESAAAVSIRQSATLAYALKMVNRNATRKWGVIVDAAAVNDGIFAIEDLTAAAIRLRILTTGEVEAPGGISMGGNNTAGAAGVIHKSASLGLNLYGVAGTSYDVSLTDRAGTAMVGVVPYSSIGAQESGLMLLCNIGGTGGVRRVKLGGSGTGPGGVGRALYVDA